MLNIAQLLLHEAGLMQSANANAEIIFLGHHIDDVIGIIQAQRDIGMIGGKGHDPCFNRRVGHKGGQGNAQATDRLFRDGPE